MSDGDKNNKWEPVQAIVRDFNLNDYIDKTLINNLEKLFEGKNINAISLSILIDDKGNDSDKPSKNAEIISFNHRNLEEKDKNMVAIDMNYPESFDKVKKAFD